MTYILLGGRFVLAMAVATGVGATIYTLLNIRQIRREAAEQKEKDQWTIGV